MCNIVVLEVTRDSSKVNSTACAVLFSSLVVIFTCAIYIPILCNCVYDIIDDLSLQVKCRP